MPLHGHQPGLGGDRVSPVFWVSPGGLILAPTPGAGDVPPPRGEQGWHHLKRFSQQQGMKFGLC